MYEHIHIVKNQDLKYWHIVSFFLSRVVCHCFSFEIILITTYLTHSFEEDELKTKKCDWQLHTHTFYLLLKRLSIPLLQPAPANKGVKTPWSTIWGRSGWRSVKCCYLLQFHIELETWDLSGQIHPLCLQNACLFLTEVRKRHHSWDPFFSLGRVWGCYTLFTQVDFGFSRHPDLTLQFVWICLGWASGGSQSPRENCQEHLSSTHKLKAESSMESVSWTCDSTGNNISLTTDLPLPRPTQARCQEPLTIFTVRQVSLFSFFQVEVRSESTGNLLVVTRLVSVRGGICTWHQAPCS